MTMHTPVTPCVRICPMRTPAGRRLLVCGEVNNWGDVSSKLFAAFGAPAPVEIIYPTACDPVAAGGMNDPGKIWVMVRPTDDEHVYAADDFTVQIDGVVADIISGSAVGDHFCMIVKPQTAAAAGDYDLKVTELFGGNTDTETAAVKFSIPGIPVDSMVIGDISGSMSRCGKIDAVKNAAGLYIDHAGIDDRIGVASFESIGHYGYPLSSAIEANQLAAKAFVDTWAAGGQYGSRARRAKRVESILHRKRHNPRLANGPAFGRK